jgi:Fe-S cluster biogenesis protein NfuA
MSTEKNQTIEHRIREAITRLRPLLHLSDPHSIELVSFDARSGVAILRVDGGCPDCEMPVVALMQGIEAHLKLRVPEIREVRAEATEGPHSTASHR